MATSPLLQNFGLTKYEQPTIQLQVSNPTADTITAYVGGAVTHPATQAGQLFTNYDFSQGLAFWTITPLGGDFWQISSDFIKLALTYPTPSTTDELSQNFTGLSTSRQYRFEMDFEFIGTFTVTLNTSLGSVAYVGALGQQTFGIDFTPATPNISIGFQFQFQPPTLGGSGIIVRSVRLLDNNNPQVQYYQMVQNGFTTRPVRMSNTRLQFSTPAQMYLPMFYVRDSVTGHTEQEYVPLSILANPYYLPAYNLIDMRQAIYTLDGQNFLQFTLPPNTSLIWSSDVNSEVSVIA